MKRKWSVPILIGCCAAVGMYLALATCLLPAVNLFAFKQSFADSLVFAVMCCSVGIIVTYLSSRGREKTSSPFPTCRKCGYNLTGNVSGKCSECGTKISGEGRLAGKTVIP